MSLAEIKQLVVKNNGFVDYNFNQNYVLVYNLRKQSPIATNGICLALSAKWVKERLRNNHSLCPILSPTEDNNNGVDVNQIKATIALQEQFVGQDSQWKERMEGWLSSQQTVSAGSAEGQQSLSNLVVSASIVQDISGKLVPNQTLCGTITLAGICGTILGADSRVRAKLNAHMSAFYITANGGVIYFEPNYGEFRFLNLREFKTWFIESYPKTQFNSFKNQKYYIYFFR